MRFVEARWLSSAQVRLSHRLSLAIMSMTGVVTNAACTSPVRLNEPDVAIEHDGFRSRGVPQDQRKQTRFVHDSFGANQGPPRGG